MNGSAFDFGDIDTFYNKYEGKWCEYRPPVMIGATANADGQSGAVPQPMITDKDKFLKGDGTWAEAQGASAVSELTDVELTNLADGEILKYDSTSQKWINTVESGGGGGGGSYSETNLFNTQTTVTSGSTLALSDNYTNYDVIVIDASTSEYVEWRDHIFINVSKVELNVEHTRVLLRTAAALYGLRYKFTNNNSLYAYGDGGRGITIYSVVGIKYGGSSNLIGDTAPSASQGAEGSLYMQVDNNFNVFKGSFTTNKWIEPLEMDVNINEFVSITIDGKSVNTNFHETLNKSDMYEEGGWMYGIVDNTSSRVYVGYELSDLTKLYIFTETTKTLIVYQADIEFNTPYRVSNIYGKHNNKWLIYQPS